MRASVRRIAILPAAAAAVGLLMACSSPAAHTPSGTLGDGPATSSTAPPTPPPTTPAGGGSTGGGSGGGATGGGSADCTLDHLTVVSKHGDAGSTHRSMVLVFTNTGNSVCRLFGYPGVAALNAGGTQIEQANRTTSGYLGGLAGGHAAEAAFLSKGESAAAIVEALAATSSGGSCTAYAGLLVTPPNETHSIKLAWDNDGCSSLQIHPVVLGTSGQG